jgi:SpoVK/Ycf46/Vps4 family AAA+-type ATPase
MSSFLGRTGSNVRAVIDYAKAEGCILFLDEIDAVAKRRDDTGEVGELKRLVTVILQEIDDWPAGSLLLAATNHPDLLDPAVWRRFDVTVEFPHPTEAQTRQAIEKFLGGDGDAYKAWMPVLTAIFQGLSLSDVERALLRARRQKVVNASDLEDELGSLIRETMASIPGKERREIAGLLQSMKAFSDHKVHDLTGVSRVTLKKMRSIPLTTKPRRARHG